MKLNIEGHEIELAFTCDPEKNTECRKKGCQEYCFHTLDIKFAINPGQPHGYAQFCVKG